MDCLDDRAAEDLGNIVAAYEFDLPEQAAEPIAHFYREVMGIAATVHQESSATVVHVPVGIGQEFMFRESDRPIADYDGHHVQVYVADFSGPHRELRELSLIKEESDQQQYRVERTSSILPAVRPCSLLSTKFAA
jgi:hypothetical protein